MCARHDAGGSLDAGPDGSGGSGGNGASDGGTGPDAGGAGGIDAGSDAGATTDAGGSSTDAAADSGGPATCLPSSPLDAWTPGPLAGNPNAIWATRSDSVWLALDTSLRHWDGTAWTTILNARPDEHFGSVWAPHDDDVWLISTQAGVRRWNGTVWADATPPGYVSPLAAYAASAKIWGLTADDVWVIEGNGSAQSLFHWDGSTWADRTPAPWLSGGLFRAVSVWAASAVDGWVVGWRSVPSPVTNVPSIMHWNGITWDSETNPPADPGAEVGVEGIWGSSGTDVWAVGYVWPLRGVDMWHFDGSSWRAAARILDLQSTSIWGSCGNDVWVGGQNGHSQPRLAHFDGASWSAGVMSSGTSPVTGLSGTTTDDVWVVAKASVGATGTIFHRSPGSPAPACGNLRLDPGEQCDPPDLYTCDPSCNRVPVCGDGLLDPGEQCDPPDGLTCDASCHTIAACGNYRIDPGEQCDPPGSGLPVCDQTCHFSLCGNQQLDPGEQCDPPRQQPGIAPWCDRTCQIPRCGNGVVDPGETCDPPSGGWTPGTGGPTYCGNDCTTHDACVECHQRCDTDPRGFAACNCEQCMVGPYGPCGACTLH